MLTYFELIFLEQKSRYFLNIRRLNAATSWRQVSSKNNVLRDTNTGWKQRQEMKVVGRYFCGINYIVCFYFAELFGVPPNSWSCIIQVWSSWIRFIEHHIFKLWNSISIIGFHYDLMSHMNNYTLKLKHMELHNYEVWTPLAFKRVV